MGRVLTLMVALSGLTHFGLAQERLTPDLLWRLGRVGLEDVSPNGEWAVYGVTYYDLDKDKGSRDLYVVRVENGEVRRLTNTPESEYNARFRPDGQKVGFLRGGTVYEVGLDGSDEKKAGLQNVGGFEYAPDMNHVLYIYDVRIERDATRPYRDLPKSSGMVFDDLMYRHWDTFEDGKHSNVFYIPYSDGEIPMVESVNIMKEPYDAPLKPFGGMEQISWSPDGKWITYTCKKLSGKAYAESTNSDIYLYELATEETRNLSAGNPGYDMNPVWSADGRYIAWNSMATAGFESDRNRIVVYDMQTGTLEEVTQGMDISFGHPVWSSDGNTLYVSGGVEATYQLFAIDVAGKKARQITEGVHNYADPFVAGGDLVASRVSMSAPAEIFRVNAKNGKSEQLTFTNEVFLKDIQTGKVEKRWIPTTDGKEMLTWVIYPPFFDESKSYPALLYCQGGPQSAVSQFWSYRWNFQMMAANGYVVIAPNRRGLPSFGQEWNDQISGDWGGQAMQDLLTAADAVSAEPFVDEERMGAVGASFGGYSVYWLAGNHNKRFKAFISHCGLFNLESWYATTEEMFFANHDLGGSYWQDPRPETYLKDSPHLYVDNWDTPILVIHGEKDFRVPVSEGIQAFHAAKLRGIPSRFLYFPDEGHWVLGPQNGMMWQRVFSEWLDKWLK